jgi:pimeloyl-ACP methyl ester carboxylesterase
MSGSSSDEFEKVGELLSGKFSVYAPDLLGFGSSDAPTRYYSLRDHAETVIRFMEALRIKTAVIAGNLVGANIAARMAAEWPERVCGLMLSHLVYDSDYARFKSKRHLPIFQKVELSLDGSHLMEYWKRSSQYGEAVEYADARALCLHQAGQYGESLHWALFEDDDYTEILPTIKTPTVVVALEKIASAAIQPQVAALVQDAKYESIKGVTAYVARTNPEAFAQVILDYFA